MSRYLIVKWSKNRKEIAVFDGEHFSIVIPTVDLVGELPKGTLCEHAVNRGAKVFSSKDQALEEAPEEENGDGGLWWDLLPFPSGFRSP